MGYGNTNVTAMAASRMMQQHAKSKQLPGRMAKGLPRQKSVPPAGPPVKGGGMRARPKAAGAARSAIGGYGF